MSEATCGGQQMWPRHQRREAGAACHPGSPRAPLQELEWGEAHGPGFGSDPRSPICAAFPLGGNPSSLCAGRTALPLRPFYA